MAIYVDKTIIAYNKPIYANTTIVKKIYVGSALAWQRSLSPLELFIATGAPHPEYAYPDSVSNLNVVPNLLSDYAHVDVDITYSYLDSYNMIEVWDSFTYDFYSYGSIGAYVPGVTVSFSSSGYIEVVQTGNGPDGGFLAGPKIMRVTAIP